MTLLRSWWLCSVTIVVIICNCIIRLCSKINFSLDIRHLYYCQHGERHKIRWSQLILNYCHLLVEPSKLTHRVPCYKYDSDCVYNISKIMMELMWQPVCLTCVNVSAYIWLSVFVHLSGFKRWQASFYHLELCKLYVLVNIGWPQARWKETGQKKQQKWKKKSKWPSKKNS